MLNMIFSYVIAYSITLFITYFIFKRGMISWKKMCEDYRGEKKIIEERAYIGCYKYRTNWLFQRLFRLYVFDYVFINKMKSKSKLKAYIYSFCLIIRAPVSIAITLMAMPYHLLVYLKTERYLRGKSEYEIRDAKLKKYIIERNAVS